MIGRLQAFGACPAGRIRGYPGSHLKAVEEVGEERYDGGINVNHVPGVYNAMNESSFGALGGQGKRINDRVALWTVQQHE